LLMCGCGVPEPSITDRFTTNNYISDTSEVYETTYNTWNDAGQTIISIAPNLDFDTGDHTNINKLFCLAFKMLVVSLAQTAEGTNQQNAAGKRDIVKATGLALGGLATAGGIAVGIGGGAAALVALAGGPITLLGLAVAGIAVAFSSVFITADNTALEDQDALDAVANTMYCNTKDAPMTEDAFSGSLEPNYFVAGSNEEKIAAVVAPFIADQTIYLNFLTIMNQYYDAVNFAVMPECDDCPTAPLTFYNLNSSTFELMSPEVPIIWLGGNLYRVSTWTGNGDNSFVIATGYIGSGIDPSLWPLFDISDLTIVAGTNVSPPGGDLNPASGIASKYAAWTTAQGAHSVEFIAVPHV